MASDSLTVYDGLKLVNTVNDSKIYTFPNFSIAVSGEGPISELMEHIQTEGIWDTDELSCRSDCSVLMESFGEKFNEKVPDAVSENLKYEFLIGTKDRLFWCLSEPSVFEIDTFWAAGSGGDFALGALQALYSRIGHGITMEEAAKAAVLAACRFNQDCEEPIDVRVMQ